MAKRSWAERCTGGSIATRTMTRTKFQVDSSDAHGPARTRPCRVHVRVQHRAIGRTIMLGGTLELLLHTVCSIGIPIRERCIYHAMHGMQRSLQVYTRYSGVYGGRGRGKQKVRNS